jgi:hypothetical protein
MRASLWKGEGTNKCVHKRENVVREEVKKAREIKLTIMQPILTTGTTPVP